MATLVGDNFGVGIGTTVILTGVGHLTVGCAGGLSGHNSCAIMRAGGRDVLGVIVTADTAGVGHFTYCMTGGRYGHCTLIHMFAVALDRLGIRIVTSGILTGICHDTVIDTGGLFGGLGLVIMTGHRSYYIMRNVTTIAMVVGFTGFGTVGSLNYSFHELVLSGAGDLLSSNDCCTPLTILNLQTGILTGFLKRYNPLSIICRLMVNDSNCLGGGGAADRTGLGSYALILTGGFCGDHTGIPGMVASTDQYDLNDISVDRTVVLSITVAAVCSLLIKGSFAQITTCMITVG